MKWIIAYDIRVDKNRRRIALRLEQIGFRLQQSVFEGECSPSQIGHLLDELSEFVDPSSDQLSAWPVGENGPARIQTRGMPQVTTVKDWDII